MRLIDAEHSSAGICESNKREGCCTTRAKNSSENRKQYLREYYQTHKTKNRLKSIWMQMISRCYNKKSISFKYYGAKGVTVCDEWRNNFDAFEKWAGNNGYSCTLTLDRIDRSQGYKPENCRWATHKEQQNNTGYNRLLTYNGKTQTLKQWSEETGVSYSAMYNRLRRGWDIARTITETQHQYRKGV